MRLTARVRRRIAILAAVLGVYTLAGFLLLPPILKVQLEKRASAILGRKVRIETVRLNPYALSATLGGLSVQEPDGTTPFFGWRRLYVRFGAWASIWGKWVLTDVEMDGVRASVIVRPNGTLNFSDILGKLAGPGGAPASSRPGRPIQIRSLEVSDARLAFADRSLRQPFLTTIGPVAFTLTRFQTAGGRDAPYRFDAVTESGERFAWSGTLQAAPLRSSGEFRVENLVLPKYAPYYAGLLRGVLADGRLSVSGRYDANLDPKQRILRLEDGALQLRQFKLADPDTGIVSVDLPAIDVAGVRADAVSLRAAIGSVAVVGGRAAVRRDQDGTLNLLKLVASPSRPTTGGGTGSSALPEVSVADIEVKGFQADVTDLAAPRPVRLALGGITVSLRDFTLARGAEFPLQLAFACAPGGTVRLEGRVGIDPIRADLKADASGVPILPFSPYVERFANARITQGALSASGMIRAAIDSGHLPAITATGQLSVDRFGLVDGLHNQDLAGFASLAVTGIRAATTPELEIEAGSVSLDGPYARVIVNADHTMNLALVAKPPGSAAPEGVSRPGSGPATVQLPMPHVEIGRIVVQDGSCRFTDRSVEPNVTMAVERFGGAIIGLSSAHPGRGNVELNAVVDGIGPVQIRGKLDVLGSPQSVDLTVGCRNVDLLPLSPYSGKYAGYELARGQLKVESKLRLEDRRLDAANMIVLDQFTFGNRVESPSATGLPVRLGVALLKDIHGQIVLDVPVQGSLEDPNFRIGRVVMRVVVNLLTKAAISPFSLIGSMFGGGGEELAYQEFEPGSAILAPGQEAKLQTLVKALTNRPGLGLQLEGSFDPAADAYALKRAKLADRVRRAIWETKRRSDPNLAPPDQLAITPEENAAMVKQLFDAAFPPGTQFGTPLPPKPAIVAPPAPPSGFFKRVLAWMTFQSVRDRRAARRENEAHAAAYRQAVATAEAKGVPLDEMTGRLAETMTVSADDLRALAGGRAQRVRDFFAGVGHISPDRLFLAASAASGNAARGPRVFLHLQ